ncbi:MAG TPA: selenocysteine-specific translation elongation factor [Geobacterales bacterium]|nr:selenocysteine-specific translation elongation factor [Geobacterales bacterium]
MKHLILGTAGHIDHGKTSLVRALTGIDTDRLKEEKERGITIELGFAHMELPGGFEVGIVDVPGHERFVRSMVAGVGGMDLVLLIVAADEGIMPQTREHLEICQLLGIHRGLVVLTKSDLVDQEMLDLAMEEVREFVADSFLADAPIVPVSSRSGAGLDRLKEELARLAQEVEEKRGEGAFRLPIDRVFTMAGFGTVVTGTLLAGEIRVGDEVEILPLLLPCRVRGIQTYGRKVDVASAGQRVAVNLQGVEHTELQRGHVVVPRGIYQPTRVVDARLLYLKSAPRELKHRSVLRLHSATYEVPAQVILLDRDRLQPGESALVQLRLRYPVLLLPGDPFVLRSYSPQATFGGGNVLDPAPPRRRRRSAEALTLLSALGGSNDQEKVKSLVAEGLLSGITFDELLTRSGLSSRRMEGALAPLLTSGEVLQVVREPRIYLHRQHFSLLKGLLVDELAAFFVTNPLKEGMGKEELRMRLPKRSDPRFFGPLLTALEKEGKVRAERDVVALTGRKVGGNAAQEDLTLRIEGALRRGGMEPPTIRELWESLHSSEKEILEHLNRLARENRAIKLKSDVFYAPEPLAALRDKLITHLKEKGEITPPEFRELSGLSRKFMIPLLEHFDAERITIRVGDKRLLRRG